MTSLARIYRWRLWRVCWIIALCLLVVSAAVLVYPIASGLDSPEPITMALIGCAGLSTAWTIILVLSISAVAHAVVALRKGSVEDAMERKKSIDPGHVRPGGANA